MVQPGRPPATGRPVSGGLGSTTAGGSRPGESRPGEADQSDWTVQATDTIEGLVTKIRDKTSMPLVTVARALVFGLLAAVMGIVVAVLVAVMLVRVIDVTTGDGNVWIAHLAVGGLFATVGAFLLGKATTKTAR